MAREPRWAPSADLLSATTLTDYTLARTQDLSEVDQRQYAMLTRWGGPGHCIATDMSHSGVSSTAYNLSVRVPPGVRSAQVGLFVSGWGRVTLSAGLVDAPDLWLSEHSAFDSGQWIYSGMDEGSVTLPPLALMAEAADVWTNVDVTVTVYGDASVYSVAWLMLHFEGPAGSSVWPGTAGGFSSGYSNGFNIT